MELELLSKIEVNNIKQIEKNLWIGFSPQVNSEFKLQLLIDETQFVSNSKYFYIIGISKKQKRIVATNIPDYLNKEPNNQARIRFLKRVKEVLDMEYNVEKEYNKQKLIKICSSIMNYYSMRLINKHYPYKFMFFNALGKPTQSECSKVIQYISIIKRDISNSSENFSISDFFENLLKLGVIHRVKLLQKYLEDGYNGLEKPIEIIKKNKIDGIKKEKISRQLPDDIKEKIKLADSEHQKTLEILKKTLKNLCCFPEENKYIDCFATLASGIPAIFEVKSINDKNELSQMRAAISQLYEYKYRHSISNANLFIVFSKKPSSDWIIDYLQNDRDIKVLWVENNILNGNSVKMIR